MIILSRSIPEIWKPIKNVIVNGNKFDLYYNYDISNYGNLKMDGRNINLVLDRKYYYASLYVIYNDSKKRLKIKVSRIVCREFNGEPKSYDYECHHINGIHTDNRSDNLIWLSPEQHKLITTANGQHPKGDLSSGSKLNEEILNIIIKLLLHKFTDTEIRDFICNEYNISITHETVSLIRNNKTWNHLTNGLKFPKTIGSKDVNNGRHSDYYIRKKMRQNEIKKILKY